MASDIFNSPGVFTRETDETFAKPGVTPLVGTVIGLFPKGKAFVPVRNVGYTDFVSKFGGLNPEYFTGYAAKSYLKNADAVYAVRILGKDTVTVGKAAHIAFPRTSPVGATATLSSNSSALIIAGILRARIANSGTLSYTGTIDSCTISGDTGSVTVSFNPNREDYIKKVLGTDPTQVFAGDSLTSWYVDASFDYVSSNYTLSSITGALSSANNASFTAGIASTISGGYSGAQSPIVVSQNMNGSVYSLFQFYSLSDGTASNNDIKISITNVETLDSAGLPIEYPKFDVVVRAFSDSDRRPAVYEYFTGVNLDPNDMNFIARAIGDKYTTADVSQSIPEIVENGQFNNKSKYIRVSVFEGASKTSRPSGFRGIPKGAAFKTIAEMPYKGNALDHNNEVSTSVYMGVDFTLNGIADRLKPTVTKLDSSVPAPTSSDGGFIILSTTGEVAATSSITGTFSQIVNVSTASSSGYAATVGGIKFSMPMYGGWDGFTPEVKPSKLQVDGSLTAAYSDASKIISNVRAFNTNLIVTPGINSSTPGNIVEKVIEKTEFRTDTFYIFDIAHSTSTSAGNAAMDCTIDQAIVESVKYDTSYAATYYPWLNVYDDENDKYIWVPPSVQVFGAYAFNDRVGQLWSSPAGFNRAALGDVQGIRKKITAAQSDTLYNARINPIVSFATDGIVIYGQKTLQRKASALDRVNVRRLLLEVRRQVSSFALSSLFEPNDPTTRLALSNIMNDYLRRVQELRGIFDFRVVLDDSTTTPDLVDRNIIAGTVFLKPTRVAEFITINFVVTPTGATFAE